MALARAVSRIGGLTFISRIAGFVRDMLMANILGASFIADAFFVALRLPNLFRALLAEGAFSAAFVPLYSKMNAQDPAAARLFAGRVFGMLACVLLVILVVVELLMPWVIRLKAPGFEVDSSIYDLTVDLSRLTFPYVVFICLTALYSGVANSHNYFAYGAFAPVWFNLSLIAALLLWQHSPDIGYALAVAVSIAGLIQFAWLQYGLSANKLSVPWLRPVLSPEVKRLLLLMLPGVIGASATQINVLIGTILASLLEEGSISWLYYADRLNQLPLGILGVALGTALLPMLSRAIRDSDSVKAARLQKQALLIGLFIALPAAMGLIMLAPLIIATIYGHGAFTAADVEATATALRMYAFGLPAYIVIKTFAAVYFAHEDTRTPVKIALAVVAVNLSLNLILMPLMAHAGIALATAIAAWVNVLALGYILWQRGWWYRCTETKKAIARMLLVTMAMAGALYAASYLPLTGRLLPLVASITLGMAVYFLLARLLGIGNLQHVKAMLRAKE
jgi:putative peptidoglycan lipid II flippase